MFKCSPVFYANQNATEKIIINQGGTDSGKTYAIIQLLFLIAIENPGNLSEDLVITVIGESVPNLKKGAYRIAKNIYSNSPELQRYVKAWNETDRTIYFHSGYIMEFTSYETEQQAKQGKRQFSFFNEGQAITYPIFWQVAKRTRQKVFIDYNPSAPFWVHDKLIGTSPATNDLSATVKLIISDHRHNPFLSEEEHRRTEGIKDKELYRVYARGLTGNLEGIIFPNWREIPDSDFPQDVPIFGGLDFGYTNDPTAGVKIARIGDSIYLHEVCYETAITPNNLKSLFWANGFNEGTSIYCEHDPDIVSQLRRIGVYAMPARKGQGSIAAGIHKVNEYKVFYTASSKNIAEERKRYMWMKDKITGKPTNSPCDVFNHCMDAIRYGVYTHLFR